MTDPEGPGRWLVALDVDGTVLRVDRTLSEAVVDEVRRVSDLGHEVTFATGRSVSMTLPLLDRFGIAPEFLVCANGAVIVGRDRDAPLGYSRVHVETFDPGSVLTRIRGHLSGASFAVEDADGVFRYVGAFPDDTLGATTQRVAFAELLDVEATRVVVLSPAHDTEEFLGIVDRMGLHKVSYNVGFTAWLDIAPDGVTKATGVARVADRLDIRRDRVFAAGDGRNDIDLLAWAVAGGGVGIAMGQAPPEVVEAASERTATDLDDGIVDALARHFPA